MRSFGILLIIFGAGSFALHAADMEFRLLQWVDNWGTSNGNLIRIGFVVLGILLFVFGGRKRRAA